MNSNRSDRGYLLVVSTYAVKEFNPEATMNTSYWKLQDFLNLIRKGEILIFAEEINDQEGRLTLNKAN